MKPAAIYNHVQIVFALNFFSNCVSSKKGTTPELQEKLTVILTSLFDNTSMQKLIGKWELVWGPVVGSYGIDIKREVASNALYVAKNENDQYVIATAGTNPISLYGWLVEDFDVKTMVLWPGQPETPVAARISTGTSTGLNHLLEMQWNNETLFDFLVKTFSISDEPTLLTVSGHSLGGALSSVLALHLLETQSTWNPSETIRVSAEPTAGATPGNHTFSDYFTDKIGSQTLRFWNRLDPVPHGWQPDMVELIPFLYYPYYKPDSLLQGIVALTLSQSIIGTTPYPKGGPYTQLMLQTPPLQGQVNILLTRNLTAAEVIQFFVDMEAERILKKLGIGVVVTEIIITALNTIIKEFAGTATVDQVLDRLREILEKLIGTGSAAETLLKLLQKLLEEIEGIMLFLIQLGYQHVTTYFDLMNVAELHNLSQSIINDLVKHSLIDSDFTNLFDKLTDPRQTLQSTAKSLGSMVENILTPDFIKQKGWELHDTAM